MKLHNIWFGILCLVYVSCGHNHSQEQHNNDEQEMESHGHDGHTGHGEHEDKTQQIIVYTNEFELFAEADVFVLGEEASILAHFSEIPDFTPLMNGIVKAILKVNDTEIIDIQESPLRKGIYKFYLKPNKSGVGEIQFNISNEKGEFIVIAPNIKVYKDEAEMLSLHEDQEESTVNTTVFTKEQSWKIDFATGLPSKEAFGQVIKTVAKIEPVRGEESVISAKTAGIVLFSNNQLVEGISVADGQNLFTVSSSDLSENNLSVQFIEAKSRYETSKTNFERESELLKDKLTSENEFLSAKTEYESAKAVYDNLVKNFNQAGQIIKSNLSGYVKQIYASNGEFVEAGQALVSISQNKNLVLTAQVQQKYLNLLPSIVSANIKSVHDEKVYSFDELNGKVLSYGKSALSYSYMIPVNLQITNKAGFAPGTLTDVYLKTVTNTKALTIPKESLIEEQGNYYVFVQIHPELFEKRVVTIGGTDGIRTEITKGISENERVVIRGATQVKLAQAAGALDPHSGHVH